MAILKKKHDLIINDDKFDKESNEPIKYQTLWPMLLLKTLNTCIKYFGAGHRRLGLILDWLIDSLTTWRFSTGLVKIKISYIPYFF